MDLKSRGDGMCTCVCVCVCVQYFREESNDVESMERITYLA